MLTDVPILGKPTQEQRRAFFTAKDNLNFTAGLLFVEAQPGCGRLISFGPQPEFACDWVTLMGSEQSDVDDALGFVLGLRNLRSAATVGNYLERVMDTWGIAEVSS